jgi:hypothetical protein
MFFFVGFFQEFDKKYHPARRVTSTTNSVRIWFFRPDFWFNFLDVILHFLVRCPSSAHTDSAWLCSYVQVSTRGAGDRCRFGCATPLGHADDNFGCGLADRILPQCFVRIDVSGREMSSKMFCSSNFK